MTLLKRLGLVLGFCVLYALTWAVWAHLPERPQGPTATQLVAARLARELPPGTPRPTVERWLSARGIEHFAYANVEDCWDLPETGLSPDDLGAIVSAMMPDPTHPLSDEHSEPLERGSVPVFFVFDKSGRSVKNLVKAQDH